MTLKQIKKLNLPTAPGCYQFYDKHDQIIYIGKAANLKNRVLSYWQKSISLTPAKRAMLKQTIKIRWLETESEIEALLLESNLVKKHQPPYNLALRDDKRFAYIKISLSDEIPGVFLTRTVDKSGKYFGPFTSAQAARETSRVLRKIFPYCNARKALDRPCFYYQIGRCLGVCAGKITKEKYLKQVIKPIILFLEGKKKKIIKDYELKIKNLEKNNGHGDNGQALNQLKFELKNMKQILASARVLSVHEKYANDVVELAKILSLPKIPERLEGYDIANIFGREAAGSMVVFSHGEPAKNEYRKFKIKIGQGQANDIRMLKEVLARRFLHSIAPLKKVGEGGFGHSIINYQLSTINKKSKEFWPLPDLIILDGGKAQLNAASQILKKYRLEIAAVAIAKGGGLRSAAAPDKLFFPGQAKALELPLASPALHLIKRVRDEAHRFALGYHRQLRSRTLSN